MAASSRSRDLAVGRLQPARARGFAVERGGEPGAVDAERVDLARQPLLAAVGLAPALDRGVERVERQRQTLHRLIDRALRRVIAIQSALKNSCGGKDLGEEPYVLRDPAVNACAAIYPDVFAQPVHGCPARRAVTLTQGPHMLSTPRKQAFSMSANASSTAAVAPTARREQAAASSAVAHADMANAIRALAMDAVEQAKSGHPGLPMGAADVATVLFTQFLKFDPADPAWPDRDRFVLSAGHGSMLLYALLYLTGYRGDDDRRRSSASASSARSPPAIRNTATRPASRPPPARSAKGSPMRSAWRSPSGIWPPSSAPAWSITRLTCSPPTAT